MHRRWYTQRALGQQLRDTVVPADRGKIYSARWCAACRQQQLLDPARQPREMPEESLPCRQGLAEILELDEAKLLEKFNDRRSNDCLLRYRVEREIADAVRDFCAANGITGVRINQDSKRWYPQGELLVSVLGFTNVDNAGVSGLELKYNDTLTGRMGGADCGECLGLHAGAELRDGTYARGGQRAAADHRCKYSTLP